MSEKISSKETDFKKNLSSGSPENKKEFTEPKLQFVEPKLTKQGDVTKITGQFFGTFNP